jgi:hypothetical protein
MRLKSIFTILVLPLFVVACGPTKKTVIQYYYPKTAELPPEAAYGTTTISHLPAPIPAKLNSAAPYLTKSLRVEFTRASAKDAFEAVCKEVGYRCEYGAEPTGEITLALSGDLSTVVKVLGARSESNVDLDSDARVIRVSRSEFGGSVPEPKLPPARK